MRIKVDENLPGDLVETLAGLGHDVDSTVQELLGGRDDMQVWAAAQGAARFFVTQDLDFSDARRFQPGSHHGLLLIRLRHPSRRAFIARVRALFMNEAVASWEGCFVVATKSKIRIRRR